MLILPDKIIIDYVMLSVGCIENIMNVTCTNAIKNIAVKVISIMKDKGLITILH